MPSGVTMDPTQALTIDPALVSSSLGQIDELDPVVAALTWALTWAAARWALPDRLRPAIPVLALAIAVGGVAAVSAVQGDPVTWHTLLRGLGAGAAAIAGHSGVREAQKALSDKPADTTAEDAE